jgi:chromosome segregation ATPase
VEEELQRVSHHCEELRRTSQENQHTILNLHNNIDKLAAEIKISREDKKSARNNSNKYEGHV